MGLKPEQEWWHNSGSGGGDGDGFGSGCGYGPGDGGGSGGGYGPGGGYGGGDGDGSGYGEGSAYGYDNGFVDGCGGGDGSGCSYGDSFGYGPGCGCGYGCSGGDGSGSGYGEVTITVDNPWIAYHYIHKSKEGLQLRSERYTQVGEILQESVIEMCKCGLHASFTERDAQQYRPANSVLTRVQVWGRVIVAKDKLVATHRKIIEVLE